MSQYISLFGLIKLVEYPKCEGELSKSLKIIYVIPLYASPISICLPKVKLLCTLTCMQIQCTDTRGKIIALYSSQQAKNVHVNVRTKKNITALNPSTHTCTCTYSSSFLALFLPMFV